MRAAFNLNTSRYPYFKKGFIYEKKYYIPNVIYLNVLLQKLARTVF
jgi:hypothetical protein